MRSLLRARLLVTLLALAVALPVPAAVPVIPSGTSTVHCGNCGAGNLRELGVYGAATMYRLLGLYATITGSDIWVTNSHGQKAFVHIETPVTFYHIFGVSIPLPMIFNTRVEAWWSDLSASDTFIAPNEVLKSQANAIDAAVSTGTPEVDEAEHEQLPGIDGSNPWATSGAGFGNVGTSWLFFGSWIFSSQIFSDGTTGVVTVFECPIGPGGACDEG